MEPRRDCYYEQEAARLRESPISDLGERDSYHSQEDSYHSQEEPRFLDATSEHDDHNHHHKTRTTIKNHDIATRSPPDKEKIRFTMTKNIEETPMMTKSLDETPIMTKNLHETHTMTKNLDETPITINNHRGKAETPIMIKSQDIEIMIYEDEGSQTSKQSSSRNVTDLLGPTLNEDIGGAKDEDDELRSEQRSQETSASQPARVNRALDREEDSAKKVSSDQSSSWSKPAQYDGDSGTDSSSEHRRLQEIAELEDRLVQEKMETSSGEWQAIEELANQRQSQLLRRTRKIEGTEEGEGEGGGKENRLQSVREAENDAEVHPVDAAKRRLSQEFQDYEAELDTEKKRTFRRPTKVEAHTG